MSDRFDREMKRIDSIYKNMTLKKAIGMADALRDGTTHPIHGEIECAVGCIKRCSRNPEHVTAIVHYNDLMGHKRNVNMTCACDKVKMPECLRTAETDEFDRRSRLVRRILKASPPKNDGILELDRLAYIYCMMNPDASINDARAEVFDQFMHDCAQRGLITDAS